MNYQSSHFICDICDAEFTTAGQLKIHQACVVHRVGVQGVIRIIIL